MQVGGQPHAQAALSHFTAGCAGRSGRCGVQRNIHPCRKSNPSCPSIQPPAESQPYSRTLHRHQTRDTWSAGKRRPSQTPQYRTGGHKLRPVRLRPPPLTKAPRTHIPLTVSVSLSHTHVGHVHHEDDDCNALRNVACLQQRIRLNPDSLSHLQHARRNGKFGK
jgi:hypothetical protein